MAKNVAQYNVGSPVLIRGEAGGTFVMQPGNVDRVVEFLDVAGITPTAHTVLTYNLHVLDGGDLTYAIRKDADLVGRWKIDSNVLRTVTAVFSPGAIQAGKNPLFAHSGDASSIYLQDAW
jgi:hypothetical protein